MQITEEIRKAHRQLSGTSAAFLEYASEHPEIMRRSNYRELIDHRHYTQIQPWPTFINGETSRRFTEAGRKVCALIKSLPWKVFNNDFNAMSRYYGVPVHLIQWLLYGSDEESVSRLLARADFVYSRDFRLKCVECNVNSGLGGWQSDLLQPDYVNTPVIARFLEKAGVSFNRSRCYATLLEHLLTRLEARLPDPGNTFNIAFVSPDNIDLEDSPESPYLRKDYKELLEKSPASLQGSVFLCHFKDLKISSGRVWYKGMRVHTIVEFCRGRIPAAFMQAAASGELFLYNGPVAEALSNKLNLALLSEHEESPLFTPEEKEAIAKYIPWTRRVQAGDTVYHGTTVDMKELLRSNRDGLVLKAATGFGGDDVLIGRSTGEEEWKSGVEKALKEQNWIVQEYVPSAAWLYQSGENGCVPHDVVWGFFLFGSRYGGCFVRIQPAGNGENTGVINIHQGAERSVILDVEE
jgi:hypothetical protein